jgi:hypothetical protein
MRSKPSRPAAPRGVRSAQIALLRQYTAAMEEIAGAFGRLSAAALEQYADMSRRFHRLVVLKRSGSSCCSSKISIAR